MLASDFCALACRRQCSCGGTQSQAQLAFHPARQEFLLARAVGTSQRCPAAADRLSARVTSVPRRVCLFISELLLLVSYSTLVSLAYNLLIRTSVVGIRGETCGFEVVAPVWSSGQ